jgi:hypothetical protein
MDSERQTGHFPGAVNLVRFLNTKPQSRHWAGLEIMLNPLPKDRSTCGRCSYTSFSLMLSA